MQPAAVYIRVLLTRTINPWFHSFAAGWILIFLVLGILQGVQDKFPDDVSGAAVGPIFNGRKLELQLMTI